MMVWEEKKRSMAGGVAGLGMGLHTAPGFTCRHVRGSLSLISCVAGLFRAVVVLLFCGVCCHAADMACNILPHAYSMS